MNECIASNLSVCTNWEVVKIVIVFMFSGFLIREIIGFFLKTGQIVDELKEIKELLTKK